MRGLPEIATRPTTRVRRWDAVVVGSALPGLVAAARLGMRGARVLVLEEAAAAERAACLREPFCFSGMSKEAVLGACLRALRVPLIDQRRIAHAALAFQVVLPDARLDVGEPALTVDEWVAWGLAKPKTARNLAGALHEAGLAERDALLDDPIVSLRGSRRAPEGGRATPEPSPHARGLPAALDGAPDRVRRVLGAWTRALSNQGGAEPCAEARALLLGVPLGGCADTREAGVVHGVLRRRIEALYGEFRTLPAAFRLVSAGGQPGVAPGADGGSGEVWAARALILNAPRAALAECVAQDPVPELLEAEPAQWRRLKLHWRIPRALVPDAMAPRVVLVRDESEPLSGANLVCLRSFDAEDALRMIQDQKITTSQWVPTHFRRLLQLPDDVRSKYDVSSLRVAVHAAAPCPIPVKEAMIDWWGPVVVEYYAGTEGGGTMVRSEEWMEHKGSVGRHWAGGTLHILDEDGGEVTEPGVEGAIYFEGPEDPEARFKYYKDEEKTESSYRGRLFTLGDVGYLDADGYLFLTDRKSHMIISGGVNIYPQEVENHLSTHPNVDDVAVIGVPSEEMGEEVKAVVIPRKAEASEALAEKLIEFCREHIAHYKCPRSIDFVEELPRLPNGKLLKRSLRDRYWQDQGSRI